MTEGLLVAVPARPLLVWDLRIGDAFCSKTVSVFFLTAALRTVQNREFTKCTGDDLNLNSEARHLPGYEESRFVMRLRNALPNGSKQRQP